MNTKSDPSRYRYVVSRRSTVAVSTFTPALYVLSTTLPESTFLSLVRTNAGPLPGLTCWNSVMVHSCPSITRTSPFLKSAVLATMGKSPTGLPIVWGMRVDPELGRASGTPYPRAEQPLYRELNGP